MLRIAMLGATAAVFAVVVGASAAPPASVPPVTGTGYLPRSLESSFLSLVQARPGASKVVLEQFSLNDGRRLGALATVPGWPAEVGGPHPGREGSVWLTVSTGPRYRSGVAGGDPAPNSCASDVVRFDPATGSSTVVLSTPSSVLLADAVPSPDGRRVALISGGCNTSYFNEHLVVHDMSSGSEWTIGAAATRCHSLSVPSWSPNGSKLLFVYGASTLSSHSGNIPEGVCSVPRAGSLAVAPSGRASEAGSWRLIAHRPGCSYQSAVFDRWGIAALEGCAKGAPQGGFPENTALGDADLIQLTRRGRLMLRLPLARGADGGTLSTDPLTGLVLVSENQAGNQGVATYDAVWTFDGRRLRLVRRYPNQSSPAVKAEGWLPTERYRLMTHCGIAWTNIAGTFWRAVHPLSDGHGNPPPGWGNPFQDGTLTLNGTTARFSSRAGTVTFQRTNRTRPPFLCS
jgi:hypothetical protein